jgi:hypothetical protein
VEISATDATRVVGVANQRGIVGQTIGPDEVEVVLELPLRLVGSRLDSLEHGLKVHWRRNHYVCNRQCDKQTSLGSITLTFMVIRDIVPRDGFQECLRVVVVLLNCSRLGLSYAMPLSAGLDYQSHGAKVGQKALKRFVECIREFRILTLAL